MRGPVKVVPETREDNKRQKQRRVLFIPKSTSRVVSFVRVVILFTTAVRSDTFIRCTKDITEGNQSKGKVLWTIQ